MKNSQIRAMMRDIDPQFQQKADARAAAAQHPRRSRVLPLVLGTAAVGCAAFAAAVWLPSRDTQPHRDIGAEQMSELEIEVVPAAAECPLTDFSDSEIRLMAPAYAPYILDIPAQQQKALADALLSAEWIPCAPDTPVPDGEQYAVYIYNDGMPYRMTVYSDSTVLLEKDDAVSRWRIPEEAAQAVTMAANPPQTDGHLTWCAADSLDPVTVWNNTRVGARVCDMTSKEDIFFKMNNTPDYFDRCSGTVKHGDSYSMCEYEFQVDLNMGTAYQHEENYFAPDVDTLISHGEGIADARFFVTDAIDGDSVYSASTQSNGAFIRYPGSAHRIDSPTVPLEDLHPTDEVYEDYDFCESRRQLLSGLALDCIENYRTAMDYLHDFDSWEILGTEEIGGRPCVHIEGTVQFPYYGGAHSFDLCIDEQTGVTVRFFEYDESGGVYLFTVTENLAFDDDAVPVTELDQEIRANAVTDAVSVPFPAD